MAIFLAYCGVWSIGVKVRVWTFCAEHKKLVYVISGFNHLNLNNDKTCFISKCVNPKQIM